MSLFRTKMFFLCLFFYTYLSSTVDPYLIVDQNIGHPKSGSDLILPFSVSKDRETHLLKKSTLTTLKNLFKIHTFVETGTFLGRGAETASEVFSEVHTIELSHQLFFEACKRFLWSENIFVHQGDSSVILKEILPYIPHRVLFYLDAHFSGYQSAGRGVVVPILKELSVIASSQRRDSVILINDIRFFQDSLYPDRVFYSCGDGFPLLREVVEAILEINPTYQLCFLGDSLLAYPKEDHVSISPLMRACTIQRLSASFPEFNQQDLKKTNQVIASASGNERNELMIYYDMFSQYEMQHGFRSFSALWYALILIEEDELESALDLLYQVNVNSLPGWWANSVMKIIQNKFSVNLEGDEDLEIDFLNQFRNNFEITEIALNLSKTSQELIAAHLDVQEQSIYANDHAYIRTFPYAAYRTISVPNQGTFFVNNVNDTIKNEIRNLRPWEIENKTLIEQFVKPGTLALDIGSHIGTHCIKMAECVGSDGAVIAFEPNKVIYRELCYNLAINGCTNVYPVRCAIGKTKSMIETIESHPNNEGGAYVVGFKGGSNSAILLPLDAFNLNNLSFIKIDVENMEADVLDGARLTILRNRPIMLIEVQGNNERNSQMNENSDVMSILSLNKIKNLGYKLTRIGATNDYLAIPKESF